MIQALRASLLMEILLSWHKAFIFEATHSFDVMIIYSFQRIYVISITLFFKNN
nr:MAG TPA: hypothetical protein [Caudoviricetes sp.]